MISYVKEFEDYIINDKHPESVKSLLPGLEHKLFIEIYEYIHNINNENEDVAKQQIININKKIKELQELSHKANQYSKKPKLILLIKEFDLLFTKEERKKQILNEIADALGINTNNINYKSYSKNNKIDTTSINTENILADTKTNNTLNTSIYDIENLYKNYVNDITNNINIKFNISFKNINEYVEINELSATFFENFFLKYNQNINEFPFFSINNDGLEKILQSIENISDKNKTSEVTCFTSLYKSMSFEQLEYISKNLKSKYFNKSKIHQHIIKKKYESQLIKLDELDNNNSLKEKILIYKEMFEYSTKNLNEDIQYEILLEILKINSKLNNFDIKYFLEYLKNPKSSNNLINKEYNKLNLSKNKNERLKIFTHKDLISKEEEKELLLEYLFNYFYEESKLYTEFKEYFDLKFLEKIYYVSKLYKGDDNKEISNYFSFKEYNKLVNDVNLDIINKDVNAFDLNQDVKLNVKIKNIKTLYVKTYELNCESYYIKNNRKDIPIDLNLEGLVPSFKDVYTFNKKSSNLFYRTFLLSDNTSNANDKSNKIQSNKRGTYIIEFIGNGKCSRAFVKIGSLSLYYKIDKRGIIFYIINENNEIVKKPVDNAKRGIWIKDRFYSISTDDNGILVPFPINTFSEKPIIVDGNYCELNSIPIKLEKEQYFVNGAFIYCKEGVIMGNNLKIAFKPELYLNDHRISIENSLKNCKIYVNLTKEENNNMIPMSYTFDNINFKDDIEGTFYVQIPPKLNSMKLVFEAKVYSKTEKKLIKLQMNECVLIPNATDNNKLINAYLTTEFNNANKKHYVQFLGKNGEIKSNENVTINFNHLIDNKPNQAQLITNKNGIIDLQDLYAYTNNIDLHLQYQNKDYKFKFNLCSDFKSCYFYHKTYNIMQDEEINLQLNTDNSTNRFDLSYYAILKQVCKTDNNEIINIITNKDNISYTPYSNLTNYGNMKIKNLKKGTYLLSIKDVNYDISINVYDNSLYWQVDNKYIISNKKLVKTNIKNNSIAIESLNLTKSSILNNNETDCNYVLNVKIKNINNLNKPRIHILAHNYLESSNICSNLNEFYLSKNKYNIINLNSSIFECANNKNISDELQYIIDRKQEENLLGNSLEKPSLLIKKKYIRDTYNNTEQLNPGSDFNEIINNALRTNKDESKAYNERYKLVNYDNNFIDLTFSNFLAYPPLEYYNCIPNKDGEISISNNELSKYKIIEVIALDNNSCSKMIISNNYYNVMSLNNNKDLNQKLSYNFPVTKDLSLNKGLDCDKFYSEVRKSVTYKNGQEIIIKDYTSISYKLIDSIDNIVMFMKLINNNLFKEFDKLSFLLKINEFKENELLEKIDKYFSHEINLYLYFRHKEIFDKYILPGILSKLQKSFIDYFLINDTNNINLYVTNPYLIYNLNDLEKILLVYSLNNTNKELCLSILGSMKHNYNSYLIDNNIYSNNTLEKKNYFNVLMDMKSISDIDNVNINNKQTFERQSIQNRGGNYTKINKNLVQEKYLTSNACLNDNIIMQSDVNYDLNQECMANQYNDLSYEDDNYEEECVDDIYNFNYAKNQKYKVKEKVNEYGETYYLFNKDNYNSHSNYDIKFFSKFWIELIDFIINNNKNTDNKCNSITGFLSNEILFKINNLTELLFLISVIDLPYKSETHDIQQYDTKGLKIKLNSNAILFTKEIDETKSKLSKYVSISQIVEDYNNRNLNDNNDNLTKLEDNKITEFLKNKVYSHETIITNISNGMLSFDLLIQIPEGSLPVFKSDYVNIITDNIEKYRTKTYKTYFYFTDKCKDSKIFNQYGPTLSVNNIVIQKGEALTYNVVNNKSSKINVKNINNILENGSADDLLTYFKNCKFICPKELEKILIYCKNKDFYNSIIKILLSKSVYSNSIWIHSFYHNDIDISIDYLRHNEQFIKILGGCINSSIISIDKSNIAKANTHLDYDPIVNTRIHKAGNNSILNKDFKETYEKFLINIIELNDNSNRTKLRLSYYLILQDKIEEAMKVFMKINNQELIKEQELLIQYDYISAYLDISTGYPNFNIAKNICRNYKNFPLKNWREMFEEIEDELIEYLGLEKISDIDIIKEETSVKDRLKNINNTVPIINFKVDYNKENMFNSKLNIEYKNIESELIEIKYYFVDIETLYSRNPFLNSNNEHFSYVKCNRTIEIKVKHSNNIDQLLIAIPNDLINKNMFIEVYSEGIKKFSTYFCSSFKVKLNKEIGEVIVLENEENNYTEELVKIRKHKYIPKVYVKCFAKYKDNTVSFYKDGYTDLRGRFNYISTNTNQIKNVVLFSILIIDDIKGSIIKEVEPPKNFANYIAAENNNDISEFQAYQNYKVKSRALWRSKNKI